MRTDTERLDYLFAALDSGNGEPLERLQAAYTLGLSGRRALDAAMGAKLVKPGEPMPELTALDLAVAELGRIRNVKGFSEEWDDTLAPNALGDAGAAYISPYGCGPYRCEQWPGGMGSPFKPNPDDRKRELTKGVALALCELDRLIRAERREHVDG